MHCVDLGESFPVSFQVPFLNILFETDSYSQEYLVTHLKLETGYPRAPSPEPEPPAPSPSAGFPPVPAPKWSRSLPYAQNRCNLYLMDALGSQIVEILTLRVQYVTTLLRNRRNPQLTRSLLISARAKKVVPARLLNLGR